MGIRAGLACIARGPAAAPQRNATEERDRNASLTTRSASINIYSLGIMTAVLAIGAGLVAALESSAQEPGAASIPLKEAKLNIEHNATANDTGFQGFIDSEGWRGSISPVRTVLCSHSRVAGSWACSG